MDILTTTHREQAGETKDLETDPTLQRKAIPCPKCHHEGCVGARLVPAYDTDSPSAVFYQDQAKRHTTNMTLFYYCMNCKQLFRDPKVKTR